MRMGFSGIMTAAALMLCFVIARVSSEPVSSGHVGVGYEHVATVYPNQETGEWEAPCFIKNTAKLVKKYTDQRTRLHAVIVKPHHGNCWTCRDDYQMKLGDQILATGSTYFGGVDNYFVLSYNHDQRSRIENEGIDIYVDKNAACNGLPKEAMKNPFKRAVESVAMD